MINAAIVGLGWWGQEHVKFLHGSSKLRYIRAVSKEADQVGDFAAQHGLVLGTEYEEALNDDNVQAIVLCTPHHLHAEQIVEAARRGKHVYCEKPLSLTRAGAIAATEACSRAGVVLGVGHDKRMGLAYGAFKKALGSGAIGQLLSVETNANLDSIDVSPASWKTVGENSRSLGLINYGVHRVDALIDLFGDVARVYAARAAGRVDGLPGVDATAVVLEFHSGVLGYLGTISHATPFSRLQAFGLQGTLVMRGAGEVQVTVRGKPDESQAFAGINTVRANVELFADAIEGGAPFHISSAQMVHTAAVLEACLESISTGQAVDIV